MMGLPYGEEIMIVGRIVSHSKKRLNAVMNIMSDI